jgi:hypothetical protein
MECFIENVGMKEFHNGYGFVSFVSYSGDSDYNRVKSKS